MAEAKKFECWAVVELFGHHRIAGFVTEAEIGGASFIRIDVPEIGPRPGHTKYYGPAAVYGIHPCAEDIAREAAADLREWDAPLPVSVPSIQAAEQVIREAQRVEERRQIAPGGDWEDNDGDF